MSSDQPISKSLCTFVGFTKLLHANQRLLLKSRLKKERNIQIHYLEAKKIRIPREVSEVFVRSEVAGEFLVPEVGVE